MTRRAPPMVPMLPAEGRLRAWRIARGDPWKPSIGAARWNRAGEAVLYASTTAALAALEARAHLAPADARKVHRIISFCVDLAPGDAAVLDAAALPPGWKRRPGLTRGIDSAWLRTRRHAALLVPSALVPGEFNVLLDPVHPQVEEWLARANSRSWRFDSRLV